MNTIRTRRLWFVIILSVCSLLATFLVVQALRQNINLFFTPTQVMNGEAKIGSRLRVGGMVEKGSIVRGKGLQLQFTITDFTHRITVSYTGILPDLFKEGQGIVALGHLTANHVFMADEVLAKHDENYMPPEIRQNSSFSKGAL